MTEQSVGFERYDDATLLGIRDNLHAGLQKVVEAIEAGELDVRRKPGGATARESGQAMVMLLGLVETVLAQREAKRARGNG